MAKPYSNFPFRQEMLAGSIELSANANSVLNPCMTTWRIFMSFKHTTMATATLLAMTFGGTSAVFAKAHDQGVADGMPLDGNTGAFVQTLDNGVSSGQNNGQRGDTASGNGGDNGLEPVVGNGANQPD